MAYKMTEEEKARKKKFSESRKAVIDLTKPKKSYLDKQISRKEKKLAKITKKQEKFKKSGKVEKARKKYAKQIKKEEIRDVAKGRKKGTSTRKRRVRGKLAELTTTQALGMVSAGAAGTAKAAKGIKKLQVAKDVKKARRATATAVATGVGAAAGARKIVKDVKKARKKGKTAEERIDAMPASIFEPKMRKKERLERKEKRLETKRKKASDRLKNLKKLKNKNNYRGGGSVGDSIKTYSSGGYVEGE